MARMLGNDVVEQEVFDEVVDSVKQATASNEVRIDNLERRVTEQQMKIDSLVDQMRTAAVLIVAILICGLAAILK